MLPFQKRTVFQNLRGIERISSPPYALPDLASVRRFYPELENSTLDTASFILWRNERKFKVTNKFPWGEVVPRYLGDSRLGKNSILEILPSFYDATVEEEFDIVHPVDDPSEIYAVSSRRTILNNKYTKEELKSFHAAVLGRGLTKKEAYVHPLWSALFNGNILELEYMVDWVWSFEDKEEPFMGVYLESPGKLCALTWKSRGYAEESNIMATTGFNHEKKFLTTH